LKSSSIFISNKRYYALIVLIRIELIEPKPCVSHHSCLCFFMARPKSIHTNNMKFLPVAMLYLAGNFGKTQAGRGGTKDCHAPDSTYFTCAYVHDNIKVVECVEDNGTYQVTLDVAAIKGCGTTSPLPSISWVCCRDDENCDGFEHKEKDVESTATFTVTGNLNGGTIFHVHDGHIAGELNDGNDWHKNNKDAPQDTCGGWGNACAEGGLCEITIDLEPCCTSPDGCHTGSCTP
jgi:hypothetical protein